MPFPKTIKCQDKTFVSDPQEGKKEISGLNPKELYKEKESGSEYFAKVEKERFIKDIFAGLIPLLSKKPPKDPEALEKAKEKLQHAFENFKESEELRSLTKNKADLIQQVKTAATLEDLKKLPELKEIQPEIEKLVFKKAFPELQKHINDLRAAATATSVIAANIARKIFPSFAIPENLLTCIPDEKDKLTTPVVLSKKLPEPLIEFLSHTGPVKKHEDKDNKDNKDKPKTPSIWKETPIKRSELGLTAKQAKVLGKIYYTALLMGHWDIINNIDLTNSGYIDKGEKFIPSIVDWGNCLGVGFGGVSQDATAFQNPDFKELKLESGKNPITGFQGAVPFGSIVNIQLPRQVVLNLFDLSLKDSSGLDKTGDDKTISVAMLAGFKEAHAEASKNLPHVSINQTIIDSVGKEDPYKFRPVLNKELFGDAKSELEPGLKDILLGRLESLQNILGQIEAGNSMATIAETQLKEILAEQAGVPKKKEDKYQPQQTPAPKP